MGTVEPVLMRPGAHVASPHALNIPLNLARTSSYRDQPNWGTCDDHRCVECAQNTIDLAQLGEEVLRVDHRIRDNWHLIRYEGARGDHGHGLLMRCAATARLLAEIVSCVVDDTARQRGGAAGAPPSAAGLCGALGRTFQHPSMFPPLPWGAPRILAEDLDQDLDLLGPPDIPEFEPWSGQRWTRETSVAMKSGFYYPPPERSP